MSEVDAVELGGLQAAVTEAKQLLAETRGFILLSLGEGGVQSVMDCSARDLLTLTLAFSRVADLSLAELLGSSDNVVKH